VTDPLERFMVPTGFMIEQSKLDTDAVAAYITRLEAVVETARKLTDFWITGYGYHKEDLYPEELALLEAVESLNQE
jgi:hypothetical protein